MYGLSQEWTAQAVVIMMVVQRKTDCMRDGICHPTEYRKIRNRRYTDVLMVGRRPKKTLHWQVIQQLFKSLNSAVGPMYFTLTIIVIQGNYTIIFRKISDITV